jgi:hypothetical protein
MTAQTRPFFQPEHAAIGSHGPVLLMPVREPRQARPDHGDPRGTVAWMDVLEGCFTGGEDFARGPEQLEPSPGTGQGIGLDVPFPRHHASREQCARESLARQPLCLLREAPRLDDLGDVGAMTQDALTGAVRIDQRQVHQIDPALFEGRTGHARQHHRDLVAMKRATRDHYLRDPLWIFTRGLGHGLEGGTSDQIPTADQTVIGLVGVLEDEVRASQHMQERRRGFQHSAQQGQFVDITRFKTLIGHGCLIVFRLGWTLSNK